MSRPLTKGLRFFDVDCSFDSKVRVLTAEHGAEGGWAWICCLQVIYADGEKSLDMKDKARLKAIAKEACVSLKKLLIIIETAVFSAKLFDENEFMDHAILTSSGIQKRVAKIEGARAKARERWGVNKDINLDTSAKKERSIGEVLTKNDNRNDTETHPAPLTSISILDKVTSKDPNPNPRGAISVDIPPAATPPTYRGFKKPYGSRENVFLDEIWLDVQRAKTEAGLIEEAIELYSLQKSTKGNPECADDGAMIEKWAIEAARDKRVERANKRQVDRLRAQRASGLKPEPEKLICRVETLLAPQTTTARRGGKPETANDILSRELGLTVED